MLYYVVLARVEIDLRRIFLETFAIQYVIIQHVLYPLAVVPNIPYT